MIYLLIGYIVSVIAVLLYRTVIAFYAFDNEDRKAQLFHDMIISIGWLPILCIYGTLGLWYAIKMGFK